jgi:hypothetical protein
MKKITGTKAAFAELVKIDNWYSGTGLKQAHAATIKMQFAKGKVSEDRMKELMAAAGVVQVTEPEYLVPEFKPRKKPGRKKAVQESTA